MTPERWQKIEQLYHSTLEREENQRAAFLCEVCAGDAALQREVESLLAQENRVEQFLERPAMDVAARMLAKNQSQSSLVGRQLGSYKIVSLLGAGGMGEVYQAHDTKLGREVAIKILPAAFVGDPERLARFQREARMLAALNHPNIATIHGLEHSDDTHYLLMELVPGQTLDERLRVGVLKIEEALKVAAQIAEALETAHEKGVIHRDLKPANVKVTPEGRVKLLDFGLAKAYSGGGGQDLSNAATLTAMGTEEGRILGTPAYMSPEQARGKEVDKRTDIWAFGCVLYELLTGNQAFRGETLTDTLASVLEREPDWQALPSATPAKIRDLLRRCLQKDSQRRVRDIGDARIEIEGALTASAMARPERKMTIAQMARRPRNLALAIVGGALLVTAVMSGVWLFRSKSSPSPAAHLEWVALTNFADSAVSRMLAFIRGPNTFLSTGQIYIKLLPDDEAVQLTHDQLTKMSPKFSPDGSRLAYAVSTITWDTWVVPVLGGEPRPMLPNASGLTWIDGQHLLFSELKQGLHMALVTANESRSESRDVYVPPRERGMAHRSSLSPDHKWVLLVEMDNGGWLPCRLVPFNGSSSGKPVGPPGARCTYVAWSADGTWMYFSSDADGRFHIWRQRFPDGPPQQVTSGATEEEGIAVAPDGRSLITSVGLVESTVWVRDARGERQISSEGYAEYPRFSPDGKKLYYLLRRGGVSSTGSASPGDLWVADLETGRKERLLPGVLASGYDISPDGRRVVFSATDKEGHTHLWLASLDLRSSPRQFQSAFDEDEPRFGPNGYLYFRAAEGKLNFAYRLKEDGSGRVKLHPDAIIELSDDAVSPDGRWVVAGHAVQGSQNPSFARMAIPLGGGAPITICPGDCAAGWAPGGQFFYTSLSTMGEDKTLVVSVSPGKSLPTMPLAGIQTEADLASIKDAKVLDGIMIPGPTSGLYVSTRRSVHRNLYSIPLQQ
jgi:serine/threonine protein kinase/Tol biopolymer transport system component